MNVAIVRPGRAAKSKAKELLKEAPLNVKMRNLNNSVFVNMAAVALGEDNKENKPGKSKTAEKPKSKARVPSKTALAELKEPVPPKSALTNKENKAEKPVKTNTVEKPPPKAVRSSSATRADQKKPTKKNVIATKTVKARTASQQ